MTHEKLFKGVKYFTKSYYLCLHSTVAPSHKVYSFLVSNVQLRLSFAHAITTCTGPKQTKFKKVAIVLQYLLKYHL